MIDLEHELAALLNRVSAENTSNTPDFILADYLLGCLEAFNMATTAREIWYGRKPAFAATESAKPERKWPLKSCIELGPNCRCPECELCGQPMPEGEEMFKYHGYSGPCPTPPKKAEKESRE